MKSSGTLIVNADDFGLSDGVNAGIIEAHETGIVTSGGPAETGGGNDRARLPSWTRDGGRGRHMEPSGSWSSWHCAIRGFGRRWRAMASRCIASTCSPVPTPAETASGQGICLNDHQEPRQ